MVDYAGSMNYGSTPTLPNKNLGLEDFNLDLPALSQGTAGYGLEGISPYQAGRDFDSLGKFGVAPGADSGAGMFDNFNLKDTGTALQGVSSLGQTILGFKQYGQAKKQAAFQKAMAQTNLANQARLTNAELADRQRMRTSGSSGDQYQSVADYMSQYGVSGSVA